jgi:hypothetical protein
MANSGPYDKRTRPYDKIAHPAFDESGASDSPERILDVLVGRFASWLHRSASICRITLWSAGHSDWNKHVLILPTTNSSSAGFLREYLLPKETTGNWTKLFAIRQFRNVESPKDYIDRMGEEYRKKLPHMTFASGGQESRNRWFIDYLMYEKGGPKLMEWKFLSC